LLANTNGFVPYPGSGEQWGSNAVGDDLYSYAFDGVNLWTGQFNYTNRVRIFFSAMRKYLLCTRPTRLAGFLYC
jgi:hypothetical protein